MMNSHFIVLSGAGLLLTQSLALPVQTKPSRDSHSSGHGVTEHVKEDVPKRKIGLADAILNSRPVNAALHFAQDILPAAKEKKRVDPTWKLHPPSSYKMVHSGDEVPIKSAIRVKKTVPEGEEHEEGEKMHPHFKAVDTTYNYYTGLAVQQYAAPKGAHTGTTPRWLRKGLPRKEKEEETEISRLTKWEHHKKVNDEAAASFKQQRAEIKQRLGKEMAMRHQDQGGRPKVTSKDIDLQYAKDRKAMADAEKEKQDPGSSLNKRMLRTSKQKKADAKAIKQQRAEAKEQVRERKMRQIRSEGKKAGRPKVTDEEIDAELERIKKDKEEAELSEAELEEYYRGIKYGASGT